MVMNEVGIDKKKLKKTPNLLDYNHLYKNFSWKQAWGWMDQPVKGRVNAAYEAMERHSKTAVKNRVAMYYVKEDFSVDKYTFSEINDLANKFANLLKKKNVGRGDRVFFFLPRIPSLYYGFLGTLKVGAIAGTLFSAFAEQALVDRIGSSGAKVLVTNKELLERVKKVRKKLPDLKTIILDEDLEKEFEKLESDFEAVQLKPDEPAFMLYTSGTTGKPKGVVHGHRAILQQLETAKYVLDLKEDDVYWCTADPGWVTGVAYEILGNWALGVSTVVYAGRFNPEAWYRVLKMMHVSVWYTAPTAIRLLMAAGSDLVAKFNFGELRHICSVGEPLNPEAIRWGRRAFGLVIHDTWFQTETAAISIANMPALPTRIGSMGKPVPGVVANVLNDKGKPAKAMMEGDLVLKKGWPSMMIKIWRRPKKYKSYFKNGWYITGDRAYRDKDGYFWFVGRADDVIKTSGERVGPFEVESALVDHPSVVEAGVIGKPDPIRGQIIKAFVVLAKGTKGSKALVEELQQHVKRTLAGHAYPKEIDFVESLPKTRSGKIVRRILRARELGLEVGDTSTLSEV